MKEAEYYQKAMADAGFRQEKINELREHRRFTLIVALFIATVALSAGVYEGVAHGHWFEGLGSTWGSVMLGGWVYSVTQTRLRALEAMEAHFKQQAGSRGGPGSATHSDQTAIAAN